MSDDVLQELRLQTAILRAGFKKDLDALAESAASDGVSAAIVANLRETGSMKSTALKAAVPKLVPKEQTCPRGQSEGALLTLRMPA